MKKRWLLLLLPSLIYADDLKSLLEFATANNKMVLSKTMSTKSKERDVSSSQKEYYPTLSLGASYTRYDERSLYTPGDIYKGAATLEWSLYDGGRRSSTVSQNQSLLKSAHYSEEAYKKELQLDIVRDFFNIKSAEASLKALQETQVQLKAELDRVKRFYEVGSTTKDDVDKLQAALSNNSYNIEAAQYEILSLQKLFSVKAGKEVKSFEASTLEPPMQIQKELSDSIAALQESANALKYSAESVDSQYFPTLDLQDSYVFYGYGRSDTAKHPQGVDNQNILMLSLNIKLLDFGVICEQKQSLLLQKESLKHEAEYLQETQDVNIDLAKSKIETVKAQIQSAKSSLESAQSAYETIKQKYQVGSVDNVAYLDALRVKSDAKAQYETALNNLQIAYASYYYYTNKNIQEYVQ